MIARYGRRGGDGPTAGKKAAKYDVTLPNGMTTRKSSYKVYDPQAIAVCYQSRGEWFVNTIISMTEETPAWVKNGGPNNQPYTLVTVTKVQ